MARERWVVDGWELTDGLVRDVETREGLYGSAPLEGNDTSIGGRDGELWGPKRLGASGFTLNLWLAGDTRQQVEDHWHALLRRLVVKHRLLVWRRTLPSGEVRQCLGQVVGRIAPTAIGQFANRASIEVKVPSGKWQSTSTFDSGPLPAPGLIYQPVTVPNFRGASAPMTDLTWTITGPCTSFRVRDQETDVWFRYGLPLTSGQSVWVRSALDVIEAPDLSGFTYTGPHLMELTPPTDPAADPIIRVDVSGGSTATTVRVQGRKSYLI